MGMDGHEWPYLVKNNMFGWEKALTLQPDMTFSDEPGDLHPRGVRRAARGRHAHHRERRGALHAAVGVAGKAVLEVSQLRLSWLPDAGAADYFTQVTSDQILGTFTFSIDTGFRSACARNAGRSRSDLKPM